MLYRSLVYIHLLSAIVWLGGTIFLAAILVPLSRNVPGAPGVGAHVLGAAARRFRVLAWAALLVLVGTGVWILLERNIAPADVVTGHGWFIQALRIKLILVALLLVLSVLHDFVIGPRLSRRLESLKGPETGSTPLRRQRRLVSWLARTNLVIALAILALAVILVRGIP